MSWKEERRERESGLIPSFLECFAPCTSFHERERAIIPVASSHSVIFTRSIFTKLSLLLLHSNGISLRSSRYGRFFVNIRITFRRLDLWIRQISIVLSFSSLKNSKYLFISSPLPLSKCIDVRAVRTATTSTRDSSNSPRRSTFYSLIFSKIHAKLDKNDPKMHKNSLLSEVLRKSRPNWVKTCNDAWKPSLFHR